jgi:pre-mRNA-processing factor 40
MSPNPLRQYTVLLIFSYSPQFVAGGTSNFSNSTYNQQSRESHGNDQTPVEKPSNYQDSSMHSSRANALSTAFNDRTESQYISQADAEAAFLRLLKKQNIGAEASWEQAMKAIIKDPSYRAVRDPKDRKSLFEKYTSDLRMQDLDKQKERMSQLRQNFTTMLKSHPEIKYYTRWR